MASNLIARYVWLVDKLLRKEHLTLKEINDEWKKSGLSYGDGDDLPRTTFYRHIHAIQDLFGITIEVDKDVPDYKYHLLNPEVLADDKKNTVRRWLFDSYSALNQVQADLKMQDRIEFEDIPSGHTWLTTFIDAMRQSKVVEITHKHFGCNEDKTIRIEPYGLKVFNRRWYIIANIPRYAEANRNHKGDEGYSPVKEIRSYGLDRISNVALTADTFELPKDFSIKSYYEGCAGVYSSDGLIERVVVRAYGKNPDYLRSLPLHESQKELRSDGTSTTFSYDVKLTYDFQQRLMEQGDLIEVLEPETLRKTLRKTAMEMLKYYDAPTTAPATTPKCAPASSCAK